MQYSHLIETSFYLPCMSTDKTRKQATGTIDKKTSFGKILGFLGDVTSRSYDFVDNMSTWKYVAFAATI